MNKKTKLILLSSIGMFLLTSLIILLIINSNIARGDIMLIHDEEYEVAEIETIEIRSVSSDINIINTDEERIRVVIYDVENKRIEITDRNGRLVIRNQHRTFCFIFCINTSHRNSRINVYMPKEYQGNIIINTVSGDVEIEEYQNSNMNIRTVSGNVRVSSASDVNINTVSGRTNISTVSNVEFRSVSGNLTVENILEGLRINSTSGNINVTNAEISSDSTIRTVSGYVKLSNLEDVRVVTNTVSGRISIFENSRDATTELSINTTSGNINVN